MVQSNRLWSTPGPAIRFLQFIIVLLLVTYVYYTVVSRSSWISLKDSYYPRDNQQIKPTHYATVSLKENIPNLLRSKINCSNKTQARRIYQGGNFWVVENFVKAGHGDLDCRESITFTTHGTFPMLDDLIPLIERWHAPISLALYCARGDFKNCSDTLIYLRNCLDKQSQMYFLRKYLSVQLIFEDDKRIPRSVNEGLDETIVNCHSNPMLRRSLPKSTQREFYPEKIARNVARAAALTHFVLLSNLGFIPSANLHSNFLKMIALRDLKLPKETVYALAVFQLTEVSDFPDTKKVLLGMIQNKSAVPYDNLMCDSCLKLTEMEKWKRNSKNRDFDVISLETVGENEFHWEPVFIGTRTNPYFEDRSELNGAYVVLLNNVFFVHTS